MCIITCFNYEWKALHAFLCNKCSGVCVWCLLDCKCDKFTPQSRHFKMQLHLLEEQRAFDQQ